MTIPKIISILSFSSSLLLTSLLAFAQHSPVGKSAEIKFEITVLTEQGDTFSAIAQREFGYEEIGVALADYNQLPFSTVFSSGEEVVYPDHFTSKPDTVEVAFSRGNIRYLRGGSEYSTVPVVRGDFLESTDVIETGPDGFVSLDLPFGDNINLQPQSRFSLEMLKCLPDNAWCAVLIDEEYGRIYSNFKTPGGLSVPYSISDVSDIAPFFNVEIQLDSQGRDWPVKPPVDLSLTGLRPIGVDRILNLDLLAN